MSTSRGEIYRCWQDIERIPFGRIFPDDREVLLSYVEAPFRAAIGEMFDKNIPTVGSSCNAGDYAMGQAWISLDYDFMDPANQAIVDAYGHTKKSMVFYPKLAREATVAGLFFPIGRDDLPITIGHRALLIAEDFEPQAAMELPV